MSDISPNERRLQILDILRRAAGPVSGEEVGERFGVGRTAVCNDVAVLRAEGHQISASPRGYVLEPASATGSRRVVAARHGPEGIEAELTAIVDAGVTVADVIVEHPVYGEIRGNLQIRGRDEVAAFVEGVRSGTVTLLSGLTGGVHKHTLWAADPARLDRACAKLRALGVLLGSEPVAVGRGPARRGAGRSR